MNEIKLGRLLSKTAESEPLAITVPLAEWLDVKRVLAEHPAWKGIPITATVSPSTRKPMHSSTVTVRIWSAQPYTSPENLAPIVRNLSWQPAYTKSSGPVRHRGKFKWKLYSKYKGNLKGYWTNKDRKPEHASD